MSGGTHTTLSFPPSTGENERPESRLLASKEMAPLDTYMAVAHVAWARRHRPHLLRQAA